LDTHIWLWSVSTPSRVVDRVLMEIRNVHNELWLSPLSVWEFLMLCRKGRLAPEDGPQRWLANAMARSPVKEATLTFEVAVESEQFHLPHGDPVDRLLVATSRILDLTLITADRTLIEARQCQIMANR
jgi:PIN domain nuclease of toxin-antitoxin system